MSFMEVANSSFLWMLVIIGIIIVACFTIYYMVLCYRKAVKMGITKETLMSVIKSSVTFSIVPSIAIVTGLATLVVVIGLPYAWFRLSVLGSMTYEVMAAQMALQALNLDVTNATGYAFGVTAFAMCFGISISLIFNIFFNKKIHMGTLRLGAGDKKWSALAQTVFMSALLCALIVPLLFGGLPSLLTFITSTVIAVLLGMLIKKTGAKWLNDFILVISMVGAMASSLLWDHLFA